MNALPNVIDQARRLVALGVSGISEESLAPLRNCRLEGALLVVHPDLAPASTLASLVQVNGKAGFVVADMFDVDEFEPIVPLPDSGLYLVNGLQRGDEMANWSPAEALPAITASDRTPLTLTEGLHWLLQRPDVLQRNACFMTIGCRKRKPGGTWDARTPAIWLSNGTGRDGPARRDAPKLGWCWAGNRHTWLGFASGSDRHVLPGPRSHALGSSQRVNHPVRRGASATSPAAAR